MPNPSIDLDCRERAGAVVIALRGELDIGGVDCFVAEALRVTDGCAGPLVLDLSRLHFADLTGVRGLVAIAHACRHLGRPFAVYSPPPSVARVLELTEVLEPVCPGLAEIAALDPSTLACLAADGNGIAAPSRIASPTKGRT